MAGARKIVRRPREQTRPTAYGVDETDAAEDVAVLLRNAHDDPKTAWCSCTSRRDGFGFDPQMGVYVHADPTCHRPSRAYYEAALEAGVLAAPVTPKQERRVVRRTPR